MIKFKQFEIYEKTPSVNDFKKLRKEVGWKLLTDKSLKESLDYSPYCVSVYHLNKISGMVRITGDKTMYGYVQDFIVLPKYQKLGIGKKMLEILLKNVKDDAYLVGVCPSECSVDILTHFGFKKRPEEPNGFMYMEIKNV